MSEPPRYRVELTNTSERALDHIRDKKLLKRLATAIDELAVNPRPHGCKKLAGHENLWRIRLGSWRISYAIEDNVLLVLVIEIEPRGSAYRNF